MTENVRLQRLYDFTIKICNPDGIVVGTGIVVSADGKIVTCAHVTEAALGVHPRKAIGQEIHVYFPQITAAEKRSRIAAVEGCFCEHDDDVVLLQLKNGPLPLGTEQIALLGSAFGSEGNEFQSYGYASIGSYTSRYASGEIQGPVEIDLSDVRLQLKPVQLTTKDIRPGMSGSAVLDKKRNLIIGLVTERWNPHGSTEDDNIAWATDNYVLTFDPIKLPLREGSLPMGPAFQPRIGLDAAIAAVALKPDYSWKDNAPPSIQEWVGRVDLLNFITNDWIDSKKRVTGLIGFGGEGKSVLARHWIDNLLVDRLQPQPKGVFWWGFSDRPSADEFFEAALIYMSGGNLDLLNKYPSPAAKAHLLGAMLYEGRYLFILDGLEAMQHQEGDQYGLLKSNDLRDFLKYFANPDHNSFCLVTSRALLLDLMEFTTYQHRDIDRLIPTDGRALLKKLGVKGSDAELDKVVEDWDGHALTLSLLGSYLVKRAGGDCARISEIPSPIADEPLYERVHRVLRAYDGHLTKAERAFLMIFSAFRGAVHESSFGPVFRERYNDDSINNSIAAMEDNEFDEMVMHLVMYRIVRHDPKATDYTLHPLIREHYYSLLNDHQIKIVHRRIKYYYLANSGTVPNEPTLDDLKPLIEAVHHACCANEYKDAWNIYERRIVRPKTYVLTKQLAAYETELAILEEFFPDGDLQREPNLNDPKWKNIILENVGFCLLSLGILSKALPFYERAIDISKKTRNWQRLSNGYQNLARLYIHLGKLELGVNAARKGLLVADRIQDHRQLKPKNRLKLESKRNSLCWLAWAHHLNGNLDEARLCFKKAEELNRKIRIDEIFPKCLLGFRGVQHVDHLIRDGNTKYALLVIGTNELNCKNSRELPQISRCHRLRGDFEATKGQHKTASEHYNTALKFAKIIFRQDILIEALLARGRWYARYMQDAVAAFEDLNGALKYSISGSYRIYEADIRVGLAWANLTADEKDKAKAEAERAKKMSEEMGYYWGKKDADEVLAKLNN